MTKQTQAEQQLAEARSILLASIEETRKKFTRVEGAQAYCFRAIALDYDGTLTESGRPDNNLLNALQELRREGRQLLLVTGRTMADLRREFADVGEWFDLMVTENGAEIWHQECSRALTSAVPTEIDSALRCRRVPCRRGRVIVACDGRHADVVLEELQRLQLDSQIVRNRGAILTQGGGSGSDTG